MAKVTTIPAKNIRYNTTSAAVTIKRRVAAYARVSTDSEEQLTSYEAQVDYYTNYIRNREDWEFVSVYTDEGISGCNIKHRDGFNRMVEAALAGKIDLIITKSVSRFARNTVDSLTTIRKLKEHGVECYFEKENIWTFDGKGELLLTIMSSLAQEESRSISENVKWGKRKQMADGKVSVAYSKFLGYDRGEDGNLVINEEQAEIVKKIFMLFVQGKTPYGIAKQLTAEGVPTPAGKTVWNKTSVRNILKNEKYKGDALLQKTYISDFLTKKQKKNIGEIPQYYVEGNHEPIIAPDVFDFVQTMLQARSRNKQSGVNIFSGKIKCGECGSWYGSKVWHSTDKYRRVIWQCNHKFDGDKKCGTPHLEENDIKTAFIKAVNAFCSEKDEIIAAFEEIQETAFNIAGLEEERSNMQEEMNVVSGLIHQCIYENARIVQDQAEYNRRFSALDTRYETAKNRLAEIETEILEKQEQQKMMCAFIDEVKTLPDLIEDFDERIWCILVDYVTVYSKEDIRFTFKNGTEIQA